MTETVTSTDKVIPPMGGLALMAERLAQRRKQPEWPGRWWGEQSPSRGCVCPPCKEYHAIIDRIARGENP